MESEWLSGLISHTADLKDTGCKNRKNEEILKPFAVIACNQNKREVDMSDQMAAYYSCLPKESNSTRVF